MNSYVPSGRRPPWFESTQVRGRPTRVADAATVLAGDSPRQLLVLASVPPERRAIVQALMSLAAREVAFDSTMALERAVLADATHRSGQQVSLRTVRRLRHLHQRSGGILVTGVGVRIRQVPATRTDGSQRADTRRR